MLEHNKSRGKTRRCGTEAPFWLYTVMLLTYLIAVIYFPTCLLLLYPFRTVHPGFASFILLRIIRDSVLRITYVAMEVARLKVENENAQTPRPRIHVQIGVQILVVRLSNS